ncbi:MAG: leucine-rich repeat domain-containing protein [Promethearchaeota archaeon]
MVDKEFKINEFISLKLENDKTSIYVKGSRFTQCKNIYLLFNIRPEDIKEKEYETIQSIDQLEQKDKSREFERLNISPQEEFWGHCSNLQAWAEHDYDTCLLHRNLSFPLLKRLSKAGDALARKVLKSEIIKRISIGYIPVVNYLMRENFLDFLNIKEISTLGYDFVKYGRYKILVVDNVLDLRRRNIDALEKIKNLEKVSLLHELDLSRNTLTALPDSLGDFKDLQKLQLSVNKLENLPESIGGLVSLHTLNLLGNKLKTLPNSIKNLNKLQHLNLSHNSDLILPEVIGLLDSLQELHLSGIHCKVFPESIVNLISLHELEISNNYLYELPTSISKLKNLQRFFLRGNGLKSLPESLGKLGSLEWLDLSVNDLKLLPDAIGDLKTLQILDLSRNKLSNLPEPLGNLRSLKRLDLSNNKLRQLPKSIINLTSLENLILNGNPLVINPDKSTREIFEQLKKRGFVVTDR